MRLTGKKIDKRNSRKSLKSNKKVKDQLTALSVENLLRKRFKLNKKILARA